MNTFVLVVHLIIATALVLLVLLQRSEGAGLVGPSAAGMMPMRGTANVLSRATGILAGLFFITSLTLAILAGGHRAAQRSIVDDIPDAPAAVTAPADAPATAATPPAEPPKPAAPVSE